VEIKSRQTVDVPDAVAKVLGEFSDMTPLKLPKCLPPRKVMDHAIKLERGS